MTTNPIFYCQESASDWYHLA